MEDNFNQNDFEEFLKDQVRNHRMYPNDTVWRDINKKLHGHKKWPALTIAAFTLLSATIAICVYFTPQPDTFYIKPVNTDLKNASNSNPQHNIDLNNLTSTASTDREQSFSAQAGKDEIAIPNSNVSGTNNSKIVSQKLVSNTISKINEGEGKSKTSISTEHLIAKNNNAPKTIRLNSSIRAEEGLTKNFESSPLSTVHPEMAINDPTKSSKNQHTATEFDDKNMVDGFLKDHSDDIALHTLSKQKTIKNKFGFQIYIAPSISYRKLLEDRSVLKEGNSSGPVGLNYVADVNNVVRHRPGNGLEVGISIMYNLSDNFRIKSGFQFNVRQYSIEAYRSSTELASIALQGNNRIDTINTLAIYRNSNGYYSTELVNRYYQLAIPIGVEWEIIGNKTIQFNVAGSIQPTYLINHNAYLLSTNFKNYSENPEMVRSFNINSNVEAFISFKAGYFKWQIGPQLRYQPYSTFIPQYPIKEHLMDYGIKIGLSKTFN